MISQAADVNPWAQFGLAGLVIGALFFVLVLIVKWLVSHIDKQAETHKQERADWTSSTDKKSEEFRQTTEKVVDQFTTTIKEIAGRK